MRCTIIGCDINKEKLGVVVPTCNPRYSGGRGKRITSLRPAQPKLVRLCLENKIQTKGLRA
jgi:hypothetical protein